MANQWRTAISDGAWVKEIYSDDPQNPTAKLLVRAVYGISRANSADILDTLNATKSVSNPYVDGKPISGTFRVIKNEIRPSGEGSMSGSDVLIQSLGQGYFTTLSASNKIVLKNSYEPEEQNENAWMYYERGTITEVLRWMNLSPTSISSLYPYTTDVDFDATVTGYDTPVIKENWYEKEQDGSYSMYRTLFARETSSTMKERTIQYAGMILTDTGSPPMEFDTTIILNGFNNETETVYENAKFILGDTTYRVTANATAVTGRIVLSIVPEISEATEIYCDTDDFSARQVYFEAVV
ncbi:MAG: hypothetical protein PHW65_00035 [Dehalococcoidales bacterium]|nr:hypothetical protein [Dehalococcoidales bacterium]